MFDDFVRQVEVEKSAHIARCAILREVCDTDVISGMRRAVGRMMEGAKNGGGTSTGVAKQCLGASEWLYRLVR